MHIGGIHRISDPEGFEQAEEQATPLGFLTGSRCRFMPIGRLFVPASWLEQKKRCAGSAPNRLRLAIAEASQAVRYLRWRSGGVL